MHRLAIVASHPIQYQAPWFRALASRTDLTVFFCHRQNRDGQAAAGYTKPFEWDIPLLDGYSSTWLTNVARDPNVFRFNGCDTPEISERLRTGHFDACIVNGWYLKSYVQAVLSCRRHGIPVLLRGDSQLGTMRSPLKKAVKYFPYRILLNNVAGHLYVGDANRRYLTHYGVPSNRLFFVPHVVDDQWFMARAAKARTSGDPAVLRQELGIAENAAIVLFVGRLVAQKRPLDFVDAIERSARQRPLVGVIVGSGPLAETVERHARQIGSPIRLAGFRNQSELPAWYAASQMIVLPSDGRETWGLVVNEAMACGLPAVVSDAVGCADNMIQPSSGRVFPLGDVDRMAEAILEVDELQQTNPAAMRSALAEITARSSAATAAEATVRAVARVSRRFSSVEGLSA